MKKFLSLVLLSLLISNAFGQWNRNKRSGNTDKKYFVGASYGVGTSRWFSTMDHSELYDKNGAVINSGYLKFKAKNQSSLLALEVLFPLGKVRFGMGICFENFYLDRLDVELPDKKTILFDESFRFDKFYGQIEVPFNSESKSNASLSFNSHIGYFNYTGIDRFNFFGEKAVAKTYFMAIGLVGDYKLYPHTYIFTKPYIEYKYFDNSPSENPSQIRHNIFTAGINFGIRVDVSEE